MSARSRSPSLGTVTVLRTTGVHIRVRPPSAAALRPTWIHSREHTARTSDGTTPLSGSKMHAAAENATLRLVGTSREAALTALTAVAHRGPLARSRTRSRTKRGRSSTAGSARRCWASSVPRRHLIARMLSTQSARSLKPLQPNDDVHPRPNDHLLRDTTTQSAQTGDTNSARRISASPARTTSVVAIQLSGALVGEGWSGAEMILRCRFRSRRLRCLSGCLSWNVGWVRIPRIRRARRRRCAVGEAAGTHPQPLPRRAGPRRGRQPGQTRIPRHRSENADPPVPPIRRHDSAVHHRPHSSVHQQRGGKSHPPSQNPATHLRRRLAHSTRPHRLRRRPVLSGHCHPNGATTNSTPSANSSPTAPGYRLPSHQLNSYRVLCHSNAIDAAASRDAADIESFRQRISCWRAITICGYDPSHEHAFYAWMPRTRVRFLLGHWH